MEKVTPFEAMNLLIELSWEMITQKTSSVHLDRFRHLSALAGLDTESEEMIEKQITEWKTTMKEWQN